MDLNQCTHIGRLTADPKLFDSEDPKSIRCTFRLAVNRQGKDGKPKADYIPVTCWGKVAEAVITHCKKGKEVTVLSEFQTEYYPPEKYGDTGTNFHTFRARRVVFGIDSQEELTRKQREQQPKSPVSFDPSLVELLVKAIRGE